MGGECACERLAPANWVSIHLYARQPREERLFGELAVSVVFWVIFSPPAGMEKVDGVGLSAWFRFGDGQN